MHAGLTEEGESVTIEIEPDAAGVTSRGCGTWIVLD